MPRISTNGITLNYQLDGPEAAPVLLFLNGLGTDLGLWDFETGHLAGRFRVLRYDPRGHGASQVPAGDYSLDDLGRDVLGLLDALRLPRVHCCGLSLGGMVAQWLGIHHPRRVASLTLCATASSLPPASAWQERLEAVRAGGMAAVATAVLARWLPDSLAGEHPERLERARKMLLATPAAGYAGCCAALRDLDLGADLPRISAPTLLIAGAVDPATPVAMLEALWERIPGARLTVVPGAAHLVNLAQPEWFVKRLQGFLLAVERGEGHFGPPDYTQGLATRRRVLGSEHVDRALAGADDFTRPFQALVTTTAWDGIWGRGGMSHPTRRLITLAMMVALNRPGEFKLHVRAALADGITPGEIREVLLQAAVYCGVPAANAAFQDARAVLAEQDEEAEDLGADIEDGG